MKKKKKVCIFTLYTIEGASSNYRILMYLEDLKKDFDVTFFPFWNKSYVTKYMNKKKKYFFIIIVTYLKSLAKRIFQILFFTYRTDVVIFQKSIIPYLNLNFIKFLHKRHCKIILDVDDAVFENKRDYTKSISNKSDVVVVGNQVLYNFYHNFNENIIIFPTVDYSPEYKQYFKDSFSNKTIGWIGSKSTINNLDIIISAVNKIVEKYKEVNFTIICDDDYGYLKKIKNSKFVQWNINSYKEEMSHFTIGIMPLYDTKFNRGKCGFKLIQYINLKKPVIASPVGVNVEIVANNGFLATSEEEWIKAFESVLFDKEKYDEFVQEINKSFDEKYSYEAILKKWKDLIENV